LNPLHADRIREQLSGLEQEVGRIEAEVEQLQSQLNGSFKDRKRSSELLTQIETRRKRIENCESQWEELSGKLEADA
jgi:predicted  nucleic acid-binding Zn-ribbon protein